MKTKEITDALKAVRGHALLAERVLQGLETMDKKGIGITWSPQDFEATAKSAIKEARREANNALQLIRKLS